MLQNKPQKEQKPRKYDDLDADLDEDNAIAMAQYDRVMRNSNRNKVKDRKINKRHIRIYDDEL